MKLANKIFGGISQDIVDRLTPQILIEDPKVSHELAVTMGKIVKADIRNSGPDGYDRCLVEYLFADTLDIK